MESYLAGWVIGSDAIRSCARSSASHHIPENWPKRIHKEVEHGEQGQEHEEEHGKEAGSKDAEREAAGQEGQEVAGPVEQPALPETALAARSASAALWSGTELSGGMVERVSHSRNSIACFCLASGDIPHARPAEYLGPRAQRRGHRRG